MSKTSPKTLYLRPESPKLKSNIERCSVEANACHMSGLTHVILLDSMSLMFDVVYRIRKRLFEDPQEKRTKKRILVPARFELVVKSLSATRVQSGVLLELCKHFNY